MKKTTMIIVCLVAMLFNVSCTSVQDTDTWKENQNISDELVYEDSVKLDYAEGFAIDHYEDDYVLISISDGSHFLLVPEGKSTPTDLNKNITVLEKPIENIYIVASAVMDMICAADGLDSIRLSGTKEENWYIDEAKQKMISGDILYAGKYNAPDYERILSENCELALYSTMITHSPEIKEKLEEFGIPVLVDYSSYENHPLGRSEWVKLYGALTGHEEIAENAFLEQKRELEETLDNISEEKNDKKTVAFFYITANGTANVRKSSDYVPKMIELAGGKYIFDNLGGNDSAASSINMQIEEFYASVKDADYMIYNGTTAGEIESIEDLIDRCPLLAQCRAVKNGDVWCTTQNMYQRSMGIGTMVSDINIILNGEMEDEPVFFYKMQ